MVPKATDFIPQDPAEKNLKTIQFLQESELSKHPVIGGLLSRAIATGDFSELDHYMTVNRSRFEAFARMILLEKHRQKENPYYPFPLGDELSSLRGPIKLGIINTDKGQEIYFGIHPNILTMHTMVMGRSGSGKTMSNMYFLTEVVKHDGDFNVIVVDVKLTYRRLIGKIPGINVIPFNRFLFNPLEVPVWMNPRDFIFLFAKVFASDNLLSIPNVNLLSDALERLFRDRGIFSGSKNYPTMKDLYNTVKKMQTEKEFGYRYRDIFETCLNRLRPYAFLVKIFSKAQGINVDVFTKLNIILELLAIGISEYVHNFVSSFIPNLIHYKNMTLGLRGDKLRTLFIVDEARTILSASRESSSLDFIEPGLNEIITKGREFGIGLYLCSQETHSFSQVFRSNTFMKISLPLTDGEDVSEIKKSFGLSDEQVAYFYKLPPRRVAVCRYGNFERPFLLGVPEVKGLDHVPNDQEVDAAMKDFYTEILPKEDRAITVRQEELSHRQSNAEIDGLLMARHLITAPFLNYKELINVLGLTPARGDQARAWFLGAGYAKPHSIVLRRGKPGEYYELTENTYNKFGGRPPAGKGSFEHKLFCHAIQVYAEQEGFNSRLEGIMDGTTKPIDVLVWKKGYGIDGYEVTLHTNNLLHNVTEDLRTTLKKVIVVSRNKDELAKAHKIVRGSQMPMDRLQFKTIFDFSQKL